MNILLLGSGGREHALAWRLAQSPTLTRLFCAPGNPGIARHAELVPLPLADHFAIRAFCGEQAIDLVVVGPEQPLVDGLADTLRDAGFAVFGPGREAARLEGSKAFTKRLCAENDIPTARSIVCQNDQTARAAVANLGLPIVVKADGLAAGKGVIIAETAEAAEDGIAALLPLHGELVIEEFLVGEEASLFALSDGVSVKAFASAQDHKRVGDGDTGPNTGGMGAYTPAPVLTPELEARAMREIVEPTIAALARRGTPFIGVLYAGLMLTADGPRLIEYNVRFGDPETQAILPRLRGDLAQILLATATGRLNEVDIVLADESALTVVVAAHGYPGEAARGGPIGGIERAHATGALVFHAGTRRDGDRLVANGGRVLGVTGTGHDLEQARARAYAGVGELDFPDGFTRSDIGWREIERLAQGR